MMTFKELWGSLRPLGKIIFFWTVPIYYITYMLMFIAAGILFPIILAIKGK